MQDQDDLSCFVPGIPISFQKSYFYYTNYISPFTMLLSVWCVLSNAAVIIAILRSGIRSIRPGLLMLCSLSFTDLLWGATTLMDSSIRIKHLTNSQVCEAFSEIGGLPIATFVTMTFVGTELNLATISIDRYLAVKTFVRYRSLVTRRRALVACSVVWVISSTLATIRQVGAIQLYLLSFLASGLVVLSAAVIIIFQILTFRLLRHHNNNVAEVMAEGNQANLGDSANARVERQLAKTATYVVGMLALVVVPISCVIMITVITKKAYIRLMFSVVFFLLTLCSCINPVLYYRGNEKVKQGISKLLKCQ